MKLTKDKHDKRYYLHLSKNSFVHAINDWKQLWGKYNWYTFHFIHIYLEDDVWTGGFEFEFVVLGIGFRFRYNYNWEGSKVGKSVKKYVKEKKKKKLKRTRK